MNESAIFNAAIKLPPEQRTGFVEAACAGNPQMRADVEALLEEHEEAGDFLAKPAIESLPTDAFPPIAEGPGTVIGHYKLLQKIGEGGFGLVYMAEQQEPVRRKVAFKIIKPGMDTREVIARFESERQALALMDHPNIARVLDAGATDSGRPYFVMELVKGVQITEYCDKNNLSTEQRLELFITVCYAVQHAHQKGVIHRDLKPSNVMVTLHDGKPVPKVIDFGVAKATSQRLTERTLFTAYGQMVGTPAYMSPEQAEMSGLDIDTRSDIYSLGVLLYELLTGTTPFDSKRLRDAGYAEMQRIIREEEPPRPSTRVSTLGEKLTIVCSHRSTDPKSLRQSLRGDLDLIIMKAMEKERGRRYDTPNSFAEDVLRFLHHEAILARRASASYRLKKFVERNRAAVATVATVASLLLLGTVVSTWLAIRESRASRLAWLAKQETEQSLVEVQKQRELALSAGSEAQQARRLAEEREAEAKAAKSAESQERMNAERERDEAQRQREKTDSANETLQQVLKDQRRTIYAAEMNLVRMEAQRNNVRRMREVLLKQIPGPGQEDLRGFEWNYWYRYPHRAKEVLRFEDFGTGNVAGLLCVLPGGNLVAYNRGAKTQFRELSSGKEVGVVPAGLSLVVNVTPLSVTGRMVAGRGIPLSLLAPDSAFRPPTDFNVWDLDGTKRTFQFPSGALKNLSFLQMSRDGRLIAALGYEPTAQREQPASRLLIWEVESGELILNHLEPRELNRLAFNQDGTQIAAYLCHGIKKYTNEVRDLLVVFAVPSGERLGFLRHDDDIDNAFFLPDGKRLLACSLGHSGRNRKELFRWTIGADSPSRLGNEYMPDYLKGAVSPDGSLFAVGGPADPTVRLIDTGSGVVVATLHSEATAIDSLTFSADGKKLIAGGNSGVVLAWDLGQDEDLFRLRANPPSPLNRMLYLNYALNHDQTHLALATEKGGLFIRQRDGSEAVLQQESGTHFLVRPSGFSPDNRFLVCQVGATLRAFDAKNGGENWRWALPPVRPATSRPPAVRSVNAVDQFLPYTHYRFSADSRQLVVLRGNKAYVLDAESGGKPVHQYEVGHEIEEPRTGLFSEQKTGRLLLPALAARDDSHAALRLLDATSGQPIAETSVPVAPKITALVASPDGRNVVVVRRDANRLDVWDVLEQRQTLSAVGGYIVFSLDGQRAAALQTARESAGNMANSATMERISEATVWDVLRSQQLATVNLAGGAADQVLLSPDNSRLLSFHGRVPLSLGGTIPEVRMWDVKSGRELMTMPVADVNHYLWELAFDRAGQRLTLLVLAKVTGSGGWGSQVFDAAPLSESEDALPVARRRVAELFREHLVSSQVIAALEADKTLKPTVREIAIELARQHGDDPIALELAYIERGHAANEKGDHDQAIQNFDKAIRLNPNRAALYVARGLSWGYKGDLDKAFESYDQAVRLDPTNPTAHNNRGAVYEKKGDLTKALEGYEEAIRVHPPNIVAHRNRAAVAKLLRDDEKQLQSLNDVIRLAPAEASNYYTRGWLMHGKKQFAKALQDFEEAIRLDPRARHYSSRAWVRATCPDESLRDAQRAVEDATRACELSQWGDARILDILAAAHAEAGSFDEAVKWAQKAVALATAADSQKKFYEARLKLYQSGKPYRVPTSAAAATD